MLDQSEVRDGIEAKAVILEQLARALEIIGRYDPALIATVGGECSVSVAPFAALARRYGEDPATVSPARVALAGAHPWADADFRNVAAWGIHQFGPGELRDSSRPLLDWLTATGCSRPGRRRRRRRVHHRRIHPPPGDTPAADP